MLRPILGRHGIELISGWYSSELLERSVDEEIKALQPHLTLLKAMGCKVVVWAETTACVHGMPNEAVKNRRVMKDSEWPQFCERLSAVAAYVKSEGLHVAYHHHMGTVIETEAEIEKLMAGTTEDVGLLLDTGHLTFAQANPLKIAQNYRDRIVHVHCKDVRLDMLESFQDGSKSFLDGVLAGVFTVHGDGGVDFLPVLKELAAASYEGWLVVEAEQDPAKANPLTYARLGFKNLKDLSLKAGLLP